jgi:hypothetical protein
MPMLLTAFIGAIFYWRPIAIFQSCIHILCFLFHTLHPILGENSILSSKDPQQGDPVGPLLFCNSIPPLLDCLKAVLTFRYLDDLPLAGDQSVVAEDVRLVLAEGGATGLRLNIAKCESFTHQDSLISDSLRQRN